jgi:hypothetical protein
MIFVGYYYCSIYKQCKILKAQEKHGKDSCITDETILRILFV